MFYIFSMLFNSTAYISSTIKLSFITITCAFIIKLSFVIVTSASIRDSDFYSLDEVP